MVVLLYVRIIVQADDHTQLPVSGTQQSVAMSSQRTAQYHWASTPDMLTQQQQTHAQLSHGASQSGGRQEAAGIEAHPVRNCQSAGSQHAASSSMVQQQQHRKAAFADRERQQVPATASGVINLPVHCSLLPVLAAGLPTIMHV